MKSDKRLNYIFRFLVSFIILQLTTFGLHAQKIYNITEGVSLSGKNIGIIDGVSLSGENIGIVDGISFSGKQIYLTNNYEPQKNEKYKVIYCIDGFSLVGENIGIIDGVSLSGDNYGVIDGVSLSGDNYGFTDNPKNADIIIVTTIELITKIFSNHSIFRTLIKYFNTSNEPTATSQSIIPQQKTNNTKAFKSKIDEDNDEILKLDNGAIIEVTSGYLGYLGYRKDCIVYKSGYGWKIWIEGKKVYRCDVLKEPNYSTSLDIEEVNISEISDDGEIIFLTDGSVYEVSYQSYETSLWLGYSSALLINGYQIINLDEGSEIIDVIKIK